MRAVSIGGGRWWATFQTRRSDAWAVWNFDQRGSAYVSIGQWWLTYRSPRSESRIWRKPLLGIWRFRIERSER